MMDQTFHAHPPMDSPGNSAAIEEAARVLRSGGLVAFPTETVYGLGADALDAKAVQRVFEAKGRPASNPLIVHVGSIEQARSLVADWNERADRLALAFWPGPLTLVLPKQEVIPAIVTAGGGTVALRMPAHPVALALVRAAGVPVAAPSANAANQLSPTTAEHVLATLDGRIDLILDGGPTNDGIESTVLDISDSDQPPRILRPGPRTRIEIEAALGEPVAGFVRGSTVEESEDPAAVVRSPGQHRRHYAPRTPVQLRQAGKLESGGPGRVAWLGRLADEPPAGETIVAARRLPDHAAGYAAGLYAALFELDSVGADRILVTLPPDGEEWAAVHDRLARAVVL